MLTAIRSTFLLLLLMLVPGIAAAVSGIDTGVPLTAQDDAAERQALERALVQALETLSRNERIGETPLAARLKKSVRDYLLEYEVVEDGEEGWLLRSRFDRKALEQALADAEAGNAALVRQDVLFWLTYGYGDRPAKLLGRLGDDKLVARVEEAAASAGIRAILPLIDLEDRRAVSVGDIENGYVEGIERASGRYHVDQYLIGQMRYRDKLWHVQLEQYGMVTVGESKNMVRALKLALNQLRSDTRDLTTDPPKGGKFRVAIAGIGSWTDYQRLTRYLEGLPGTGALTPAGNDGEFTLFDVEIERLPAWLDALRGDGVLVEQHPATGIAGVAYHFSLVETPRQR